MGYDLRPRNKALKTFYLGAFSFPVLLEACGYLWPCINKGPKWYCVFGVDKRMPKGQTTPHLITNDGFRVTAQEARIMARTARNFVAIQRSLPDQEGQDIFVPAALEHWPRKIRDDWVEKFEAFAEWAEQSRGFAIW